MVGLVLSFAIPSFELGAVSVAGLYVTQNSYRFTGFAFANFNIDIIGACERIRKEAETLAGENYGYHMKMKTGALDFITSPENGGVDASLISWDGGKKIATLKLLYDQRTKVCQIGSDCNASVCDEGSTPVRKQAIIEIKNCVHTPIREYHNQDMVALCKDTQAFIKDRMMNDIMAAHQFLSQRVLAELDSEIGTNDEWDGTDTAAGQYKDIQLLATEDGQRIPKPGNWAEVLLDYANNQLVGTPAVIGQGNFQMFAKLHDMSCCNATTPYGDANISGDARFYLDQQANTVLGPHKFILAAYKAVHLLTFNENRNIGINTPTQAHFVMADPFGYPFDWNVDFYFDNCSKMWKNMLSLTWGTFNVFQDDSFAASGEGDSPDASPDCSDSLDGLKGIFGYRATAA